MIERKKNQMYTSQRKIIHGHGFIDTIRDIGSYIYQNKDLIAKPMLGAVGNIGALALTEGSKAIVRKLAAKQAAQHPSINTAGINPESRAILTSLLSPTDSPTLNAPQVPQVVSNVIGSGMKKF